jgi:hypothetical protein
VLRKVPTMEPLRGTKERVGALFTASENVRALISNLGG